MTRRRWALLAFALLLAGAAVFWWNRPAPADPATPSPYELLRARVDAPRPLTPAERERRLQDSVEARLATDLNLPDGTIQSDVAIVGSMIAAFRSIYREKGNPIGDNREIVRTLQGANANGVIFLARQHRALNAAGELCDRWGTPFFFHAESGTHMEIRSAGPDRQLFTPDDVAMVP